MSYQNLDIDCHDDNIYVITMRKKPENRLNVKFAQEIIRALRDVERRLGKDAEGAVIIRGSDAKFWCTVGLYPILFSRDPTTEPKY
jgi:Delta3-Delta2-enoyl-CoA isomerase